MAQFEILIIGDRNQVIFEKSSFSNQFRSFVIITLISGTYEFLRGRGPEIVRFVGVVFLTRKRFITVNYAKCHNIRMLNLMKFQFEISSFITSYNLVHNFTMLTERHMTQKVES